MLTLQIPRRFDRMVNAWSLLYDEMENKKELEDIKHSTHWYDYDRNDPDRENPFISTQDFWVDDGCGISINSEYPSPMNEDRIELNLESTEKNGFWKYEEDKTMKEIRDYLSSTYNAHYTSPDSKTQTLDLIESIGDAEPFCRSNAIKYLSRFGKKNGKSKQDILKAIHYCVLLYHFSGIHNQPKGNYETF